jgi:DNA-binding NarL/FixJ family response regulator
LTPREKQIVDVMMSAATNKTIAARLGISEQSVKNRLSALYRKMGVSNRLELVVKVMSQRD